MTISKNEKIEIINSLNWDYDVSSQEMLDIVEGKKKATAVFTQEAIFIRCLERISWHRIVELWGIETIKKLYSPILLKRIRSKELRSRYDTIFRILRKEPVSIPRWGSEYCRRVQNAFLSDRWHRT